MSGPSMVANAHSDNDIMGNKAVVVVVNRARKLLVWLATLDGIDVIGSRLADEVISVIECNPNVENISIIGHSLGCLISRYDIANLYTQNQSYHLTGNYRSVTCNGKIAGIEAINFITVATLHTLVQEDIDSCNHQ
ncbi:unnamed protein product [Lactuca virosa]|uniref:DUF676 domain-containing protein n=1 Tax=Lactuca virosa TaxID=75947 RepID=A0AAU9LX85_9ASTR|nr:unnamed protein product [Lactuca virosa]